MKVLTGARKTWDEWYFWRIIEKVLFGRTLVSKGGHCKAAGPKEYKSSFAHAIRKVRVFTEIAISRMDSMGVDFDRFADK